MKTLTAAQFARRMKVTAKTIHNWRRAGLLDARELPNGRYLIPYSEYERIMKLESECNGQSPR